MTRYDPTWWIITTLMAYRVTRLWTTDMLPPLPRWRAWAETAAENRWNATKETRAIYGHVPPLDYLITCAWCSGFWISTGVFTAAALTPVHVWTWIAAPWAMSAVIGHLAANHDH